MRFVFTPDWFLGSDFLIESFSFVVLFIFFILCIRNYKLNKNKKILYLGAGFALIALAQLAMILAKFALFYDTPLVSSIGLAIIESSGISSLDVLYGLSFFAHRVLTLLGFYIIYRLPRRRKSSADLILGLYFIGISAFLGSEFYYLFHATALVILSLITFNYYTIYKKNKFINTKILMIAFGMLALSQFLFMMSNLETVYVLANVIELVSYTTLLILIGRILKYGKKTKPNGYNIRYSGHYSAKRR